MKTRLLYIVLGICCLRSLPASGNSFFYREMQAQVRPDSNRTMLPLKIVYDGRMVTPVVEVLVNGQKIEAVFDSGSSGLRVLNGALTGAQADSTGGRVGYSYGDSKRSFGIRGNVVSATLRLGSLTSRNLISIMRIDSVRYGKGADWTETGDSSTIHTNHFRSLPAILGAGMRLSKIAKGVGNPLAQLPGNGKYIVSFPRFGGTKGKLIINPDSTDLAGFTLFKLESSKFLLPNGDSCWRDNELLGCIIVNGESACQYTMLDTGNPDIHVESKNFSGNRSVFIGSRVAMSVEDKAGIVPPVKTTFTVSNMREDGKDYVYLDESDGKGKNIFGDRFFFDFDVMYDQVNGFIGIKKKP